MDNKAIKITSTQEETYTLISIELDGVIEPSDLKSLTGLPDIVSESRAHLGIVLSGRAPIWLYGYLIHHYHPCAWVAVYDPRLGAVIVQSHDKKYTAGDIIPVSI